MLKRENMTKPRNLTFERVYNFALSLFNEDRDKTLKWWMTPSPDLDNKAPWQMVKEGKGRKLMRIMEKCAL